MNKKSIGFLLAGLILLPSCMRVPTYKRRSLHLFRNSFTYTHSENNVTVNAKRLNIPEKDYLFDGRSDSLYAIETVYFSIHNLSSQTYCISPAAIDLKQIPYQEIKKTIKKTNSISRLSGAAAGSGLIALPFVIVSLELLPTDASAIVFIPLFIGAVIVGLPLGLTFLAQGIKSVVMNTRISRDLKEKTLHKQLLIKSGEHYEGIIFVDPSDYQSNFNLTLHAKGNTKNDVVFDVDLH